MAIKIGFAVITYNDPERTLRLVRTLNATYGDPPIVCHHDFGQCPLDESLFPRNVRFVHPHLSTGWCHINAPLSALTAFSLLREHDQPDWYVLLSGSDYPVRKASEVIAELANDGYDAYMDHREILYGRFEGTPRYTYGTAKWIRKAYDRYSAYPLVSMPFPTRLVLKGNFSLPRKQFYVRNPHLISWIQPGRPRRLYAGAFWIQLNRKAMNYLLDPSVQELVEYFRPRPVPEEALFQTALCNHSDLRICNDHKRYEDWTRGGDSPGWIESADVPKIRASGMHFARKFRSDGIVQDIVDESLLGIAPTQVTRA